MKECCKDAFNEPPSKWRKWGSRFIYLVIFLLLVFIMLSQYLNI